ncbi:MAG TPA: hypothetical protein VGM91_05865 [Conexibacter sp.]
MAELTLALEIAPERMLTSSCLDAEIAFGKTHLMPPFETVREERR